MFDKVKVLGENKSPLFEELTNNEVTGKSDINWNFEKFLIDKEGNIVKRFRSKTEPEDKRIYSKVLRVISAVFSSCAISQADLILLSFKIRGEPSTVLLSGKRLW